MIITQGIEVKSRKEWFLNRIGQRVFRGHNGCGCDSCRKIEKTGLIIRDTDHASSLYAAQAELGIEYYQK